MPAPAAPAVNTKPKAVVNTSAAPLDGAAIEALLQAAEQAYRDGRYAEAREAAAAAHKGAGQAPEAAHALFVLGLAVEGLGEHEHAARYFQSVAEQHQDSEWAERARVRAARLWVFLQQWPRAESAVAGVSIDTLGPLDAIAVLSARALARLEAGELGQAESLVGRGRSLAEGAGMDQVGELPRDLAQLYFALGELRRRRGEEVKFDRFPDDFATHFESRAQWLLDAQAAYSDVMRANDAHWTAMAGYQVGMLYLTLHREVMAMPLPEQIEHSDRREAFVGAMRLRYSILLRKGLAVFEHTLSMAHRTGEHSPWVQKATEAKQELVELLAEEERKLDASPHSRQELGRVLSDLAARR